MGWIIDFAAQAVAQLFGEAVAKERPWWVELIATLGCLAVLGLFAVAFWFVFVVVRP